MKTFEEKKKAKLITIEVDKNNQELHVIQKRFNPDTGEEIDSGKNIYLKNSLQIRKTELENELEGVKAMLKEFDKE